MRTTILAFALVAGSLLAGLAAAQQPAAESRIFVPHISHTYCGRFFDAFDDPATGWFTGEGGGLLAAYTEGEYRLRANDAGTVWFMPAPEEACDRPEYRAAVTARWVGPPGNFYGLLFDADAGAGRAYVLAVNTEARVWLVLAVEGEALGVVMGPTGHDAIRSGGEPNRLMAERRGERVTLAINETAVGELRAASPGAVAAGLVVASYTTGPGAEARFDEFLYE
jgi:hypothetical protein